MICYRDRCYCSFSKCAKWGKCDRALTPKVKKAAQDWMPNPPIGLYAAEPPCFQEKSTKFAVVLGDEITMLSSVVKLRKYLKDLSKEEENFVRILQGVGNGIKDTTDYFLDT